MKKQSTIFLRGAVVILGLAALAICIFALPGGLKIELMRPVIIAMYATVLPFYFALWQTLKLLNYIDANTAFSDSSVRALRNIRWCAFIIGALYAIVMPFIYQFAEFDDAPGVIVVGLVIIFASVVMGVFAAVLEKLLQNAIDIKKENDLMV